MKALYRIQLYHEMLSYILLPLQSIMVGWFVRIDRFSKILKISFKNLQNDDVKSIKNYKQTISYSNIIDDLIYIQTNFSIIVESNKKLRVFYS